MNGLMIPMTHVRIVYLFFEDLLYICPPDAKCDVICKGYINGTLVLSKHFSFYYRSMDLSSAPHRYKFDSCHRTNS